VFSYKSPSRLTRALMTGEVFTKVVSSNVLHERQDVCLSQASIVTERRNISKGS